MREYSCERELDLAERKLFTQAVAIAALTKALETSMNIIHDNVGGVVSDIARERLWKDIQQKPEMKQIAALLVANSLKP